MEKRFIENRPSCSEKISSSAIISNISQQEKITYTQNSELANEIENKT
jgi:hypothetical protein